MTNKDIENETNKRDELQQAITNFNGNLERIAFKMDMMRNLERQSLELNKNIDKLEKATSIYSKTLIRLTIIIAILTFIMAIPIMFSIIRWLLNQIK